MRSNHQGLLANNKVFVVKFSAKFSAKNRLGAPLVTQHHVILGPYGALKSEELRSITSCHEWFDGVSGGVSVESSSSSHRPLEETRARSK